MKIVIDKNIPYIQGALEPVAEVVYLPYKEMTPDMVKDADALIVRTRTKCNKELLEGSKVKFIATATIGYDHIDTQYCEENNIAWTNAPGCNAMSVAQYMASVFCLLAKKNDFELRTKTLGIVGVGNVGKKIEMLAKSFGMQVLLNDPPRVRREGSANFVSLEEIARKADIITFHTPLNMDGEDKTYHLADMKFYASLERMPIIINAARGEIVDTGALKQAMKAGQIADVVLDCWEHEPDIDLELLRDTVIATPHIAGYSADGKANATSQSVQSLSRFFQLGLDDWKPSELPERFAGDFSHYSIDDFLAATYKIEEDDNRLKSSPETFEKQRSDYPVRREPKAYKGVCPKDFEEQFAFFFM